MKKVLGVAILVLCFTGMAMAGEKEEFNLQLQTFLLQGQNINLARQLLIKDLDAWQKLEQQMQDLNKKIADFQSMLASKNLEVDKDGKVVDKKAEPKK